MGREQILIVEDEASVSELVERVLQRAGFTVLGVVESSQQALARVAAAPPDLVVMDVQIPGGMDGIELACLLQARHEIPVIFLTGQNDKATLERALISNSFGYLVKPFRLEELVASVEIALAKSHEARQLRDMERSLSAAVRAIGEAVMLTHPDGRLQFVNPAAADLLGPNARSFLGLPLAEVLGLRIAGKKLNMTSWLAEMRRTTLAVALPPEAMLELPNDLELPVEGSAASVKDRQGGQAGVVLTFRDISQRRRAEQEAARSREELRRLAGHLQTAREEERTVIARELHDELGQLITVFKIDLVWLEKRLKEDADPERISPLLGKVKSMVEILPAMVSSIRRISAELRPPVLDDGGLPAALEWLTRDFQRRSGVPCQLDIGIEQETLSIEKATALFRIVQESLTNVMRHAAAQRVQVELWDEGGFLFLRVQDNGRGLRAADRNGARSFGLLGMRERAWLLGGEFQITSRPAGGTTVLVQVPLGIPVTEKKQDYDSITHCR